MLGGVSSGRSGFSSDLDVSVWEDFLKAKSSATARNYRDAVRFFVNHFGFRDLGEAVSKADEQHVVEFIRALKDRRLSPMTVRLYFHGLKALLELFDKPINWNRVANLLPPKRRIRFGEAVPKDVVLQVLQQIGSEGKRLAVWLIWSSGLRIREALGLKVRDLDFTVNPPKLTAITEKTHEPREIPLPPDIAEALKEYIVREKLDEEDYLFHPQGNKSRPLAPEKLRDAFKSALLRIGRLERDKSGRGWRYTIHGLRRSYESNLVRAGVSPLVVAILLGHRIGVETHYLRLSYEDIVKEWKKAENLLILREVSTVGLEERVKALEEAIRTYENILDKLAKKFPNLMNLLELEE
ncbi:MAG: site-specific integrase [Nitrososphaerota archaeon]